MSDNPFESSGPVDPAMESGYYPSVYPTAPNSSTPVPLVLLLATLIIFSLSGFMGSVFQILGVVMQSTLAEFQQNSLPAEQLAFQRQMNQLQQDYMLLNLIPVVLNLFIAPLILASSVCGLMRVTWSRKVLSATLFVAAGFIVLRTVLSTVMQVQTSEIMKDLPGFGPMAESMGTFMYIGIAIWFVISLAMFAFYVWGAMYLRTKRIHVHFEDYANAGPANV